MGRRRRKLLWIGAGIAACLAFLLAVALGGKGGLVYYYTVGELRDLPSRPERDFRVNGKVEAGSVERRGDGLDVRFVMTDGRAALPVEYHGVVPDAFVEGADVVVEGGLREDGTFVATSLLAKCPSKYEAARDRGEKIPHRDGRAKGV